MLKLDAQLLSNLGVFIESLQIVTSKHSLRKGCFIKTAVLDVYLVYINYKWLKHQGYKKTMLWLLCHPRYLHNAVRNSTNLKNLKTAFLTYGYMSGCTKEGIKHDWVEWGVQAINWRHSSQHRIGQAYKEKGRRRSTNNSPRSTATQSLNLPRYQNRHSVR